MKKLISSVLFIFVVISSVLLLAIYSTNKFISEDSLKNTVEKIDVSSVLLNSSDNSNSENGTNKIIDSLDKQVLDDVYLIAAKGNVTKDKVDSVINSNAVKDFTALYVNKIATYVTTGKENNITGEEITKVVKDNINSVATEAGLNLDDSSKNAIISVVDTYDNDIANLVPTPKSFTDKVNPNAINMVQKVFSSQTKIMLFTMLGISIALLVIIQFKKYRFMKWLSLAFMLSGIIVCILGSSLVPTLDMILENENRFILDIIKTFASDLKMTLFVRGGIVIGLSLIILLIYEAIHRKISNEELDNLAAEIEEEFKER